MLPGMVMQWSPLLVPAMALSVASVPAFADFTYEQTSQVTYGSLLPMTRTAGMFSKEGHQLTEADVQTISVKANRMVKRGKETAIIIDLDQQTMTTINLLKKTYSVNTFEQMKQQMSAATEKLKSSNSQAGHPSFNVSVHDTGRTKDMIGNKTHEVVTTMIASGRDQKSGVSGAMNIVNEMWIAPRFPDTARRGTSPFAWPKRSTGRWLKTRCLAVPNWPRQCRNFT